MFRKLLSFSIMLLLIAGTAGAVILTGGGSTGGGGGTGGPAQVQVQEVDGTPQGAFTTLIFPNGVLTNNGDGSVTIASGTGGTSTTCLPGQALIGSACFDVATQAELDEHAALVTAHSATNANIPNRIVLRDGAGNFSAGTVTAALAGNASTATALATDPVACLASPQRVVVDFAANGTLVCQQLSFSDISGILIDAQIPDLNTLSSGLVVSRCVETDGTGKLGVAAGPCGVSGGSTGITGATNHGIMVATGGTTGASLGVAGNGQLPIGLAGGDPVLGVIGGTANQVQVTNGPGTITVSIPNNPTLPGTTTGIFRGSHILPGSTSGTLTLQAPAVAGTNAVTFPLGSTDFTGTGGAGQVVKQAATGAALTVGSLSKSDVGLGNVDNTADVDKNSAPVALTNKQIVPRIPTCAVTGAGPFVITPNADTTDVCESYALTGAIQLANPTATGSNPRPHQRLEFALKSAAPQIITVTGSNYDTTCGQPFPTGTTGDGNTVDHFLFAFNPNSSKWCPIASSRAPAKRLVTFTSALASPTLTCASKTTDRCQLTATGATGTITIANPTGLPDDGDMMLIALLCTAAHAVAWDTQFVGSPNVPLPTTGACAAGVGAWTVFGVQYSASLTPPKWQLLSGN